MRIIYIYLCIYAFLFPFLLNAQRIFNIPDSVFSSQQKEILTNQKLGLTEQVSAFKVHKIKFETRCKGVERNTSLDAACKIEQKEIENKRDLLINDINKFNETLIAQVQRKIIEIHTKISRDSIAIRSLHFSKSTKDFENREKLSQKEKENLIKMDKELLVDGLTASLGKMLDELTSINLKKANDVKKKMEELGITNPFAKENKLLQKGIILLGQAKDKKEKGEAIHVFIDGFGEMVKKGLDESKDDPSAFEKFKEVVGYFLLSPEIPPFVKLAVTGIFNAYTLINACGELYYGKIDIDNMTNQTEEGLKNLKSFTDLMKGHVAELIKAKNGLAELQN